MRSGKGRRALRIVAGETRSGNRTKWATNPPQVVVGVDAGAPLTFNGKPSSSASLADLDVNDLVSDCSAAGYSPPRRGRLLRPLRPLAARRAHAWVRGTACTQNG